jgi:hypothetical protein
MKKLIRLKIGSVALLLLLALLLLTFLIVKRKHLTAEEGMDHVVRAVYRVEGTVVRDRHAAVAFLVLMALFAFVAWTALDAKEGDDRAPAREPSASATTGFAGASAGEGRRSADKQKS